MRTVDSMGSQGRLFWAGVALFAIGSIIQLVSWGASDPVFWAPLTVAIPLFAWMWWLGRGRI